MRNVNRVDPEAEARRRDALQRLAAAALLEEVAGYRPVAAWDLAGRFPTETRLQICAAGRNPIRQHARSEVLGIVGGFDPGAAISCRGQLAPAGELALRNCKASRAGRSAGR